MTAAVDVPGVRVDEVLRLVELDDLEVRRPTLEDVQSMLTANDRQGSLT